jgi:protein TonB
MPTHIPLSIANVVEEHAPSAASVVGVPHGMTGGAPEGIPYGILTPGAHSLPPKPRMRRLRVSQGVVEGLLLHQVKPVYPPLAIQTHTQGEVVLHAIIGRDGTIASLQAVSGHPLLAPAAVAAVREWRYRPYTLNGEPVEVETLITVRFVLGN